MKRLIGLALCAALVLSFGTSWSAGVDLCQNKTMNATVSKVKGGWTFLAPAKVYDNQTVVFLDLDLAATKHMLVFNHTVTNNTGAHQSFLSSWNMTLHGSYDGVQYFNLGTYDIGVGTNATQFWNSTDKFYKRLKMFPANGPLTNATWRFLYRGWTPGGDF